MNVSSPRCATAMNEHETVDWEQARVDFELDGSLRDVYVFGTNAVDWQKMLTALETSQYSIKCAECSAQEGSLNSLSDAEKIFSSENCQRPLLQVEAGSFQANCHFFSPTDIEFDIDPRQITGQQELDDLINFMKWLASSVDREVVLTLENCPDAVILKVLPHQKGIIYFPVSSSTGFTMRTRGIITKLLSALGFRRS